VSIRADQDGTAQEGGFGDDEGLDAVMAKAREGGTSEIAFMELVIGGKEVKFLQDRGRGDDAGCGETLTESAEGVEGVLNSFGKMHEDATIDGDEHASRVAGCRR
jgi:hypothetical protein